uniref:Putative secreted protein n=1 Tax=Ixodes ricinus TaxID=34613 RepID=A0A6B0UPI8_IXORI
MRWTMWRRLRSTPRLLWVSGWCSRGAGASGSAASWRCRSWCWPSASGGRWGRRNGTWRHASRRSRTRGSMWMRCLPSWSWSSRRTTPPSIPKGRLPTAVRRDHAPACRARVRQASVHWRVVCRY